MFVLRIFAVFLFGCLVISGPAKASTVVYDKDYFYDLKAVSPGQSNPDLFTYSLNKGASSAAVIGSLAANSKITFTYTLTSLDPTAPLKKLESVADIYSSGSYFYLKDFLHAYYGASEADTNGDGFSLGYQIDNGVQKKSTPLVTTLANFDASTGIGTASIINNSATSAYFMSVLDVFKKARGLAVQVGYSVVSNVPLPASLPLFICAVGGLFFLAQRRKQQA